MGKSTQNQYLHVSYHIYIYREREREPSGFREKGIMVADIILEKKKVYFADSKLLSTTFSIIPISWEGFILPMCRFKPFVALPISRFPIATESFYNYFCLSPVRVLNLSTAFQGFFFYNLSQPCVFLKLCISRNVCQRSIGCFSIILGEWKKPRLPSQPTEKEHTLKRNTIWFSCQ